MRKLACDDDSHHNVRRLTYWQSTVMESVIERWHCPRVIRKSLVLPFLLLGACGAEEQLTLHDDALFSSTNQLFPRHQNISVCWLNAANRAGATHTREAVESTWERYGNINFTGWGPCSGGEDIRIRVGPQEWPRSYIGPASVSGPTMWLNFDYNMPEFSGCRGQEAYCNRALASHEFGHALGFNHEQDRPDRPASCNDGVNPKPGDNLLLGSWDPQSIMNYCASDWNNGGDLTTRDIQGIHATYGIRRLSASQSTNEAGNGVRFGFTEIRSVDEAWKATQIDASQWPVVITQLADFGTDTADVRVRTVNNRYQIRVQEETSGDTEVAHVDERVTILRAKTGNLRNRGGTIIGRAGRVNVNQTSRNQWRTVNFGRQLPNAVVLAQVLTYNGAAPVHTRIRNVTATSFQVKLEEWDYSDGAHNTETVAWVAFTSGNHRLKYVDSVTPGVADIRLNAQRMSLTHANRNLPYGYGTILQTQTTNGAAAVSTRVHPLTYRSRARIQEEQAADGTHNSETVGYIQLQTRLQ